MPIDFDTMAAHCAPNVAVRTLRAMALVESGFNRHAIGVVNGRLARQPRNLAEAISTSKSLEASGARFSAGLIQIYVKNWPAHNLDHQSVFDPCANMRAAAHILGSCYFRASTRGHDSQVALRNALSCYYSNNFVTGYHHGYVQKVVAAAMSFDANARKIAREGLSSTEGVSP
jgi:type IV secretion system protein VirB1